MDKLKKASALYIILLIEATLLDVVALTTCKDEEMALTIMFIAGIVMTADLIYYCILASKLEKRCKNICNKMRKYWLLITVPVSRTKLATIFSWS